MKRIARVGLGKLAVVATLAIVLGTLVVFGQDVFSSGPLSEEHPRQTPRGSVSSHAEITSCSACHAPRWSGESMATRCLKCHENVSEQITNAKPMHGKIAAGEKCTSCHTEHKGRHAALTDMSKFDHDYAAFPLVGVHQQVDCAKCHTGAVYQGTPQTCVSCHAEPTVHKGKFGTDCAQCHSPQTWKTTSSKNPAFTSGKFNHDVTGFALRDKHATLDCKKCHVKESSFKGLSQTCVSCHKEPETHLGKFGTDCKKCHNTKDWSTATLKPETLAAIKFDHDKTAFALTGKHRSVDCKSCHTEGTFKGTPTKCIGCHEEPTSHKPHPKTFGTNCAGCHSTASWQGAKLLKHTFPVNHGARKQRSGNGTNACKVCHPDTINFTSEEVAAKQVPNYATYTCYGCHNHTKEREARRHARRKVADLDKCASCHKTGRGGREGRERLTALEADEECPAEMGNCTLTSCPVADVTDSLPEIRLGSASPLRQIAARSSAKRDELPVRPTTSIPMMKQKVLVEFLRFAGVRHVD
jgi:predicted CXXCH cytochrome family protein